MATYRLGVLKGDGIGPEIVEATLQVLEAAQQRDARLHFDWVALPMGWEAIRTTGSALPDSAIESLERCDAWILGPHDSVSYPPALREVLNPSGVLRKRFDVYANIRPARAYPGLQAGCPRMDLVIARENTEGFYADRNMAWGIGEFMPTPDVALAVGKITRQASERIARTAFALARQRRRKVAIVTFSPDGSKILFANRTGEGPTSLWTVDVTGENADLLYSGPSTIVAVDWSPRGDQIAFAMSVDRPDAYEIFLMNPDGSNVRQLTRGLPNIRGSVDWSPDGRSLLIYAGPQGDRNIFLVDVAGETAAQLTNGGNNASATFSPDGQWIAFIFLRNNDQAYIFIMRPDGSDMRQVTPRKSIPSLSISSIIKTGLLVPHCLSPCKIRPGRAAM